VNAGSVEARKPFDRLLGELRPKLHRYCARMTGSVIDGEDIVQEAIVKAIEALPNAGSIAHPEGWLFRIAHNTALDFLRRRTRQDAARSDEDLDMAADPVSTTHEHQIAAASLHTFMRLPVIQRSCVILMDVLGYSLQEITEVTGSTIPAVKAALNRGRARLRELALEHDDRAPPALPAALRPLFNAYVERFNARDFDAIRDMLAGEVRLELVNKTRMNGKGEVSRYFGNYSAVHDWQLVPGFVDRRPAILVCDPLGVSATPAYFVLLDWVSGLVVGIRDFRHARYAIEGAELLVQDSSKGFTE
jgi:RNA polymerase sigma-70 factor (ECF subfamily)